MRERLEERIAYGRRIRRRADCLIEAHGALATAEALLGSREPGLAESERCFWEAVAARVERLSGHAAVSAR